MAHGTLRRAIFAMVATPATLCTLFGGAGEWGDKLLVCVDIWNAFVQFRHHRAQSRAEVATYEQTGKVRYSPVDSAHLVGMSALCCR